MGYLMLSCARKISMAEREVRRGKWKTVIGRDVYAKTLGLMGFGAIAKNVARVPQGFQ
jgi:D-3-phosphoglycerate dehydrogenase / 2-oxoglutarate reductase